MQRLRVLLADDDAANRNCIADILVSLFGHTVVSVVNGLQALDMIRAGSFFDMVISDYEMPHMDGLKLLKTIRGNNYLPKAKLVLMSGVVGDEEDLLRAECDKLEKAEFLSKPVSTDDIRRIMSSM